MWIAFLFASVLGVGRSFAVERDRGTLEGLGLLPVPGGTLFLGKFLSNALFLLLVQLVWIAGVCAALHPASVTSDGDPVCCGGEPWAGSVGDAVSALSASSRSRELLMPLLLFPLALPIVIGCVRATTLVYTGDGGETWPWFNLLAAFDVMFIAVAYAVFDFVLEE